MFLFSVIPRVSYGTHHTPSLAYLHCSFFLKKMHALLEIQRISQSRHQADIFEESVSIEFFHYFVWNLHVVPCSLDKNTQKYTNRA